MKKIITIGILSMFLLTSFSVFVVAENEPTNDKITLDYIFDTPVIENVEIADTIYDQIQMNDAPNCGNPGEPSLPAKGAYILIPQGRKVSSIAVDPGEMMCLGSGFLVEPVGQPVPLSEVDSAPLPAPDEEIYSSSDMFPGRLFTEVGTYSCKGYEILVLRLHPVQYIPRSGELYYYPDLSISVETVSDGNCNGLFRGLEKDKLEVMDKVDNPDMVSSYAIPSLTNPPAYEYDLLIITSEELKDGFQPLKEAHESDGLDTLIYSVEDIYSEYSGVDNAEKIRNFIIDAYANSGIEYVLLGGDYEIIPAKYLYIPDKRLPDELNTILSDLYYAGLDGNWNGKPESPIPGHKDLSISDPGVNGYCEGPFFDPVVDTTEYIVGGSSMRFDGKSSSEQYGSLFLTLDSPLDISDKKWIRFSINVSRPNLISHLNLVIHDRKGFKLTIPPFFSSWTYSFSSGSWQTHIVGKDNCDEQALPVYFFLFNFKKIKKIEFKLQLGDDVTSDDYVRLDGIYFSKFSDLIFGEPGEEDFYAEVFVGRACVNNSDEVQNFISKTVGYMNTDDDDEYLKNVSMVGQHMGFSAKLGLSGYNMKADWGGNFMDDLIGKCYKYWYITQGFPKDKFNIDKLYDKFWKENNWPKPGYGKGGWPKEKIIDRINNNVHIINHDGHGNEEHNMKMENPDIDLLNNEKYCFIYSQACLSGAFDHDDCMAEYFTVKTDHGAFAGIWNTNWGFGPSIWRLYTTDGISQRYHREFWDAVFNENKTEIGRANQDSKEDNIWRIDEGIMRVVYYELTLFGDPAVQFKYLDSSLSDSTQSSSSPSSSSSGSPSSQQSSGNQQLQSQSQDTLLSIPLLGGLSNNN